MNKLTNKEIAKVFALYFDAEVSTEGWDHALVMANWYTQRTHGRDRAEYFNTKKLFLTPLDQISDEDAIEVAKIMNSENNSSAAGLAKYVRSWIYKYRENDMVFQYLISEGYAVPLWFGIDHWANGQTAIELGIAIKK